MARVIEERREVNVYAGQRGHVCIKQLDYETNQKMFVLVHPDDIPQLIEYLQEAQAKAYLIRAASPRDKDRVI